YSIDSSHPHLIREPTPACYTPLPHFPEHSSLGKKTANREHTRLDGYNWRAAESRFNSTLPQYRTTITVPSSSTSPESLRIHFVHKCSKNLTATPLLLCHTWPSSFIEVQRVIDALTDPHSLPGHGYGQRNGNKNGAQQAFHIIAPSIPGFGFSDASQSPDFGIGGTAEVFAGLMARLGYKRWVAHGTGWGFSICRALALRYPEKCLAVHTANPVFDAPTYKSGPVQYLKNRIAKMTKAKVSGLDFGGRLLGPMLHRLYSLRPQTLAYSLCDSPVGLLAALLDVIHTRDLPLGPLGERERSPFLSPVEPEMRGEQEENDETETERERGVERGDEGSGRSYTWNPTEVLNFTMLQWLPGPEAALRWLRRAHMDTTHPQFNTYTPTPLGISTFYARNCNTATPLTWGRSSWDIAWVKRYNNHPAMLPGFEAPDLLVLDLRECFGGMVGGRLVFDFPNMES
ncbi:alpha/beta-hydrolase, partial [Clathrospora elynae]